MKSKVLKRSSLHYRLATVYGGMSKWDESELETDCDYRGYVIRGFFNCILIVLGISFFTVLMVIFPVMEISINLYYGIPVWGNISDIVVIGLGIDVAILIAIIVCTIVFYLTENKSGINLRYTIRDKVGDSFVGHSWTAIKDKVCSRISFED